jgi:hypothetical protein
MEQNRQDAHTDAGSRPAQTEVRKNSHWPPLNALSSLPLLYVAVDMTVLRKPSQAEGSGPERGPAAR